MSPTQYIWMDTNIVAERWKVMYDAIDTESAGNPLRRGHPSEVR